MTLWAAYNYSIIKCRTGKARDVRRGARARAIVFPISLRRCHHRHREHILLLLYNTLSHYVNAVACNIRRNRRIIIITVRSRAGRGGKKRIGFFFFSSMYVYIYNIHAYTYIHARIFPIIKGSFRRGLSTLARARTTRTYYREDNELPFKPQNDQGLYIYV